MPDGSTQSADSEDTGEQRLLTAVSDPMCRKILRAASDEAMTATEIAESLELPLSTIYRKLKMLGDTPVVEESYRVSDGGNHAAEYEAIVDSIHITLSESDDTMLTVDRDTDSD